MVDSVSEIRRASKSVYYPVETSQLIPEIIRSNKKYAFVGLPCFLKGLRLAAEQNHLLAERIVVMVGLVCGQAKSKYFAEYLTAKAGGQPAELKSATFRVKDSSRHHLDHRFQFITRSGEDLRVGHIYQSEGMSGIWGQDWFKLNACNYCDDITAEVADVTFGDAVDDRYSYKNLGANFVIVRSPRIKELLLRGAKVAELVLDRVPVKAIIDRQKGVILNKREDLRHRLYMRRYFPDSTSYVPMKRVVPGKRSDTAANNDMAIRDAIRNASRAAYAMYRYQPEVVDKVMSAVNSSHEKDSRTDLAFRLWCRGASVMQQLHRALALKHRSSNLK
jgi:coenzyme F420-reducing hydrogenase beta subunit